MSDFYAPNPNKDLLLVTVQHTGTRFVQRLLSEADIQTAQIHAVDTRKKQLDSWLNQNEMADLPIIVSLRNPVNVAQSWWFRANKHSTHNPFLQIQEMFKQWAYLAKIIAVSKPLFLPVDHPEREHYLQEMSVELGRPLSTRWKKYGHRPGAETIKLSNATIDGINELIATTFLKDFYQEVPHGT